MKPSSKNCEKCKQINKKVKAMHGRNICYSCDKRGKQGK